MKLAEGLVTHMMMDEHVMVSTGQTEDVFQGFVRSNDTAAFIIECLKEDTSREEIIDKMLEEYDATREQISEGVDDVLSKLRGIGALAE